MLSKTSGTSPETLLRQLAKAAVQGDALLVRATAMELVDETLAFLARPVDLNDLELCVAAGLVELLANRTNQAVPEWVETVGQADQPYFLVRSALRMPRLRRDCEQNSPEPLRKRNLYAPANYLTWL
jgi:hypothetical protein